MIDRSVDQFVVEECTDVAAKLCIPFGGRGGGICSALCRDGGVSERRIERLAGALHHQEVVSVYGEMVGVVLMEEAELAIGRADADQHPARGGQARQHSAIDLGVWRCSRFVAPKRHFVKDGGNHGATANGAVAIRVHSNDDAVAKLDLETLDPRNLARQGRARFEKAAHITEHRAGLINRGGKNESSPLPARSKLVLVEQRAADPTATDAEWDALFRSDIGAFLDDELIDAAIDYGRPLELPPLDGVIYRAFTDAAGGGGSDSYTLAIGHKEGDAYVADCVRGTVGKFDPQSVTEEYAKLCRQYRVRTVVGDNYGRDWVAGAWRKLGFEYIRSPQPKGAIYLESLPVFTRGLARLPDHTRLVRELRLLERRTHRSGKDS